MKLEDCFSRIDKYLDSNDYNPRFVDINDQDQLGDFISRYRVGDNEILTTRDFSRPDENLQLEKLWKDLDEKGGCRFLTTFTSYVRLYGDDELQARLNELASKTFPSHLVIVCYQCEEELDFHDQRLRRLVYLVDGKRSTLPKIKFVAQTDIGNENVVDGIDGLPQALETSKEGIIVVKTKHTKDTYLASVYDITDESNLFSVVVHKDPIGSLLKVEWGTQEEWAQAAEALTKYGSWWKLFDSIFESPERTEYSIQEWDDFDELTRWFFFLNLKLYGSKKNWALAIAGATSESSECLVRNIYRSILSVDCREQDFWKKYEDRKKIISAFSDSDEEILDYLKMAVEKGTNEIYYLTDMTLIEKEKIIELLANDYQTLGRNKIEKILSHIYPDLQAYLADFDYKVPLLNQYFRLYKYCKVVNHISDDLRELVDEQAEKREFNSLLSPRSTEFDKIDKKDSRLYFVDALGAEFLSYIQTKCQSKGLMTHTKICHCDELPSVTYLNKAFYDEFDEDRRISVKELDTTIHDGMESLDYTKTKLPIHIIKELEIIDKVLNDVRKTLSSGEIRHAYIVSDHGASRLAVINETTNKIVMSEKGKHGGRCCPKIDSDTKPEKAIEGNGYWVLANYDRFGGSRAANVEVHGGATLEEVTIPIIDITKADSDIDIHIHSELPIITGHKKKAYIEIFSKTKLSEVTVTVYSKTVRGFAEKKYSAVPTADSIYGIELEDIRRAGKYLLDVYSDGNLMLSGLEFDVKTETGAERNLL